MAMSVKKVKLKFDSLLDLWCFKQKVHLPQVEIDTNSHLLTCELSDDAINIARNEYKAEIFDNAVDTTYLRER